MSGLIHSRATGSRGFCRSLRDQPLKFLDSLRLDIVQDEQRSCHFVPLGTPFILQARNPHFSFQLLSGSITYSP